MKRSLRNAMCCVVGLTIYAIPSEGAQTDEWLRNLNILVTRTSLCAWIMS